MVELVRERLCALIAEHGRSLCTTPRVISMILRQDCPDAQQPIQDIELALTHGCVAPMLAGLPENADVLVLSQKLVDAAGLNEDRARWAIETWIAALCRERPETSGLSRDWSQWNKLDVSSETGVVGTYHKSIVHLLIVAAAGALGGTTLGWLSFLRDDLFRFEPWRDAVADLPEWAQGLSVMALGFIGGGVGGLLGWIFGGGRSWTYQVFGSTTLGRLGFAAFWAYAGANIGVLGGLAFLGLIGAMIGAVLGAFLGAFLGLVAAERISRFWW